MVPATEPCFEYPGKWWPHSDSNPEAKDHEPFGAWRLINAAATIQTIGKEGYSRIYGVRVPARLTRYIVKMGSIAIDGGSPSAGRKIGIEQLQNQAVSTFPNTALAAAHSHVKPRRVLF
jgi:hypothetical protein